MVFVYNLKVNNKKKGNSMNNEGNIYLIKIVVTATVAVIEHRNSEEVEKENFSNVLRRFNKYATQK